MDHLTRNACLGTPQLCRRGLGMMTLVPGRRVNSSKVRELRGSAESDLRRRLGPPDLALTKSPGQGLGDGEEERQKVYRAGRSWHFPQSRRGKGGVVSPKKRTKNAPKGKKAKGYLEPPRRGIITYYNSPINYYYSPMNYSPKMRSVFNFRQRICEFLED